MLTTEDVRKRFGYAIEGPPSGNASAYMHVVDHGWYDRKLLPSGLLTRSCIELFETPIGSEKGPEFTNMWMANCLPAPTAHSARQIVALFGNNTQDVENFRRNYIMEFHIGMKIYERLPLLRFPLWGSLERYVEQDGTIEVQYRAERPQEKPLYTVKSLRFEEPWAYNFDVPQLISSQQYFSVKLVGTPVVPMSTIDVTVLLNGLTAFGVQ